MHVVYVCSPDRGNQLFVSLRTLLTSGTTFRRVTIYCVGPVPSSWRFADPRFVVEEVPDLGDGFWMTNKVHICQAEGGEVIFLDTDTIILKPLDGFFSDGGADVAGRVSTYVLWRTWDHQLWQRLLRDNGAKSDFPYLSTGVIVFRKPIPAGLGHSWLAITKTLRESKLQELDPRVRANQLAFSLACAVEGLTHDFMSPTEHAYGWRKEPHEGATVYHAGTMQFFRHARRLAKQTSCLDPGLPIPQPSMLGPYLRESLRFSLSRIRGRLERVLRRRD